MSNNRKHSDAAIKSIRLGCVVHTGEAEALENELKELRHFKDSHLGLYAIDRNPKEVSKEWIEKNSFQIS